MDTRKLINLGAGCALLVLASCGKKEEASAEAAAPLPARAKAAPGAEKIPGENELRAAMAEKNYSTAVDRLFAMQPLLATEEQRDRYSELYGELRETLSDASSKDPKAAEALVTLRSVRNGR